MSRRSQPAADAFPVEVVPLSDLRPHPRNYRAHPADQLDHLVESLAEYGVYRNVVIARDGTILAGHGVIEASKRAGLTEIPVRRLPLDPDEPRALKLLVADNTVSHLAEDDHRMLSELLKEVKDEDVAGLLGTGYDEKMLAALVFVTRSEGEVKDLDAAAQWAGLPEYDESSDRCHSKVVVSFLNAEDRAEFCRVTGLDLSETTRRTWFPHRQYDDLASVRFES